MLRDSTAKVSQGAVLSDEEVHGVVADLIAETVSPEVKADFLTALARKGESVGELAAFARELLTKSILPSIDDGSRAAGIVDVCGTGGDTQNTFNISTTVGLLLAAGKVPVAKHGNRAVTSASGSADVLEALGIPITLPPDRAVEALKRYHFAFFFAPHYHPAFKHISPARKLCASRGQRTLFNLLGPLLNPARPSAQLVGVPAPALCEPIAQVLQSLGVRRAMVVSGRTGPGASQGPFLDEFSTLGETIIAEFYQTHGFNVSTLSPDVFPLQPASLADLRGGSPAQNATMIQNLLDGTDLGPRRDAVLVNAAAALVVSGCARNFLEGWAKAAEWIDNGEAKAKLAQLAAS